MQEVEERAGYGVRARVDGRTVLAGNRAGWNRRAFPVRRGLPGGTTVYVAVDGVYAGRLLIEDELKEDAARAVAGLKEARVREIVMLTGDSRAAAEKAAKQVGIDRLYGGASPR